MAKFLTGGKNGMTFGGFRCTRSSVTEGRQTTEQNLSVWDKWKRDAVEVNNNACRMGKTLLLQLSVGNVLKVKGQVHRGLFRDPENLTIPKMKLILSSNLFTYAFPTTLIANNLFYFANILALPQTPFFLNPKV